MFGLAYYIYLIELTIIKLRMIQWTNIVKYILTNQFPRDIEAFYGIHYGPCLNVDNLVNSFILMKINNWYKIAQLHCDYLDYPQQHSPTKQGSVTDSCQNLEMSLTKWRILPGPHKLTQVCNVDGTLRPLQFI